MQRERITLQNIKGIGDKISEKIINSVGGEDELQKLLMTWMLKKYPILKESVKGKLLK